MIDEFMECIPENQKTFVETVLSLNFPRNETAEYLRAELDSRLVDYYLRLPFEPENESSSDHLDNNDLLFITLLRNEKKAQLASFAVEHKHFTILRTLVANESKKAQDEFEKWFKIQPEYDAEIRRAPPTTPPIKGPTIDDLNSLLSSPQRQILCSVMNKGRTWRIMEKIIATETEEAQSCLKTYLEKKTKEQNSQSTSKMKNSKEGDSSRLDNCDSESEYYSEFEEDDDKDPTTWSPNFQEGFFNKFAPCTNILILGETGVGKSTFINGLANYLRFGNLFEAKDRVEILIKAHFTHSDQHYEQRRIECEPTLGNGSTENESTKQGESSTQDPMSYIISFGPSGNQKKIRIIDTPGIGDTRGIEQEKENFEKILKYIASLKELHAICILMKPNESKLTVTFRHCINELLTHLHVSACHNIVFCFTHARTTFYEAGDTLPLLKGYLDKLQKDKNIKISLNKKTLFFFDNESFRCLCAYREGANFTPEELATFNISWKTTVKETFRLFKQISQLPVHQVSDTLSVNDIRSIILTMAKPLAEIYNNQLTNIQIIDEKIKEVEELIEQGKSLDGKLVIDVVELVPKELDHPNTVCASSKCVTLKKLNNHPNAKEEVCYTQICHSDCALPGVQTEFQPNPELQKCYLFQKDINDCKVCHCSWADHIHIRYELKKERKIMKDPTVEESLQKCQDDRKAAEILIENEKKRRWQLEQDANMINQYCVEFAAFVKENSVIPYNDVYKEYVDHLIKEEKNKAAEGGSTGMMKKLEEHRDQYTAQIKVIDEYESKKSNKTVEEIYGMFDDLKQMKKIGPVLKEIQKLELISREKAVNSQSVSVEINNGWFYTKFIETPVSHVKNMITRNKSFFVGKKDEGETKKKVNKMGKGEEHKNKAN